MINSIKRNCGMIRTIMRREGNRGLTLSYRTPPEMAPIAVKMFIKKFIDPMALPRFS